ncbi:hypothetical protein B0H14DRAFT_3705275 [Mycena olivaceomarginata]|nr:hypothetical protein B0H14DRAFT_3705275 [Mycena olivaceomarginata]
MKSCLVVAITAAGLSTQRFCKPREGLFQIKSSELQSQAFSEELEQHEYFIRNQSHPDNKPAEDTSQYDDDNHLNYADLMQKLICPAVYDHQPQVDDIKRVFHPHAELPEVHLSFEEYRASQVPPKRRHPTDENLGRLSGHGATSRWPSFRRMPCSTKTRSHPHLPIRRCAENIADFTLHNQSDLNKQWDLASKNVQRTLILQTFCWDAEQCYIFDGTKWQRFYTEPWTAEAMWEIQCSLRNGSDWGGGQIVGWLPVVEEDPLRVASQATSISRTLSGTKPSTSS